MTFNPHWKKDYCPLILPSPRKDINLGLNESLLPEMNMSELAVPSEDALYEFGQRTLIVLKGNVFDVTAVKSFSGPTGAFMTYSSKDISYALTKSSILKEDVDVVGYGNLSMVELEVLDNWLSLFLKRFKVVGKISAHS
ncbi:hypothetical protein C8R45DRAFT_1113222 [Mycena sanguinolenta]|nr:hypothetical protein C8R45DRAFT_1113222 [Mycena sanguinolenta]